MNLFHLFKVNRFFVGAVALCLVLGVGAGCGKSEGGGKLEVSRYTSLGEVMGSKLNELAGGKGSIVLVIGDKKTNPEALVEALSEFRNALNKSIQVTATETVTISPTLLQVGDEPLSADHFMELLQKYPDADYLVSFAGLPVLSPAQIGRLPSHRPQVVEVVVFGAPTKAMVDGKIVSLLALPKRVPNQSTEGLPVREVFDVYYQMVTAENAGVLAN
jgi:hypothetical protein